MIQTANDMSIDEYHEFLRTGRMPARLDQPQLRVRAVEPPAPTHRYAGLQRGSVTTRGRMNKSEEKWAAVLEEQRLAGIVRRWWFEPMRLRVTDPSPGQRAVYFTADFLVELVAGPVFVDDVKGGAVNDASIVRMKAAASRYALWTFRLVKKVKKADGEWQITQL